MNEAGTAPTRQQWESHAKRFVQGVIVMCCGRYEQEQGRYNPAPDTGTRAALRLGLGKPVDSFSLAAHRAVFAMAVGTGKEFPDPARDVWLSGTTAGPARLDPARERAYYAVAAMIAAQARDARDQSAHTKSKSVKPTGGLGASIAEMDRGEPLQEETPREKELRVLVKQSLDGIHRALPDLVGHLRAKDIEVDWTQLIADLSDWPYRREEVTKRWNQEYYRTRYKQDAEDKQNAAGDSPTTGTVPEIEEDGV
jgi:CRISPR system Cascade subunit CasB